MASVVDQVELLLDTCFHAYFFINVDFLAKVLWRTDIGTTAKQRDSV